MKTLNRLLRDERGVATITEYAVVLPICLFLILLLFVMGFFLHQASVLDTAAERGIVIAQKIFNDPNADSVYNFEAATNGQNVGYSLKGESIDASNFKSDPYRYWTKRYNDALIRTNVEKKVKAVIKSSQLLISKQFISEPNVTYNIESNFITKTAVVDVSQSFQIMPMLCRLLGLNPTITLKAHASMRIENTTEFVRNVDFVVDLLERYGAGEIIQTVHNALGKISDFFTN